MRTSTGEVLAIEDRLLEDFFDEALIEEKDLKQILDDYTPEAREQISDYIIHRLAEVCPGYLPQPVR